MLLFTAARNSKVTLVLNFIPSKFWSLPQEVSKVILHTGLNFFRESSIGSRFVIDSLLCYKWSQTRSSSCTNFISLLTFIKVCPVLIQNNMHCWWTEIKENSKYKLYGNIEHLSKITFWYYSNDTKRNLWGAEEVGLPIPRTIVDIPVLIETFWILLTSDLDQLADDRNENHNYIASLFIL